MLSMSKLLRLTWQIPESPVPNCFLTLKGNIVNTINTPSVAIFKVAKTFKIFVPEGKAIPGVEKLLLPGKHYEVDAIHQERAGSTTSDERMEYLRSRNAILAGAQGICLISEKYWEDLPKGFNYASFCARSREMNEVPSIYCYSMKGGMNYGLGQPSRVGGFELSVTQYEGQRYGIDGFLCFREA